MLHSALASRVVLHIRAQAGDNRVLSEGLTEVSTTFSFHDSETESSRRATINASATKRPALQLRHPP